LTRGRAVRIRGGPFLGVDGRIEALRGETEVWLNVDILGQAVKVKIERALIEVLD
jgi:transcription antitermination factor NusG